MATASQTLLPKTAHYPLDRAIEVDQGYWRVAYVKPRDEKALTAQCQEMDVGYFLPFYKKRTRRKDTEKIRKGILPLFLGYFPFVGRDGGRLKVLKTNRIVNLLEVLDQERFVHDLSKIWHAAISGAVVEPCTKFEIGGQLRIKEGPMQGLVGTIEKNKKNHVCF